MPDDRERDIDLVLLTGAGASTHLAIRGENLPLMNDWSDEVVKAL